MGDSKKPLDKKKQATKSKVITDPVVNTVIKDIEKPKVKPKFDRETLAELKTDVISVIKPFEMDRNNANESDTATILKTAFDIENIDMITELSSVQIKHMSRGDVLLNKFNLPCLNTLMDGIKIKSISKDRQSRSEMIEFNKSNEVGFPEEDKTNGLVNRLVNG